MSTIGTQHALSYGGNFRHNSFDISIAPDGENRNEGGAYVQDEIFLGDRFRWVIGGRIDKFSSIDNAVFSPRTTLMYKPSANQTVRVSFNRAFRAPSLINNHLDVTLLNHAGEAMPGCRRSSSRPGGRQSRSRTGDAHRLRDRLHGRVEQADDGVGGGVLEQHRRCDLLYARRVHTRPPPRQDGRCVRRSS